MTQHVLCCAQCHAAGTAQGENTGTLVERERIIKLLKSNNKLCTEITICIEANEGYPCNCTDLINLIKEERK
jgi:hypothetical protein